MKLNKILKEFKKIILDNYIDKDIIEKQLKKLYKERNKLIKNRTDRVYDNYKTDELINVINIKIDTIKNIMGGKNV